MRYGVKVIQDNRETSGYGGYSVVSSADEEEEEGKLKLLSAYTGC